MHVSTQTSCLENDTTINDLQKLIIEKDKKIKELEKENDQLKSLFSFFIGGVGGFFFLIYFKLKK
jgi:hypothetical protein